MPFDGTESTSPDTPYIAFLRGPLPESGLSLNIQPRERGLEREWHILPTKLTGRFHAKQNSLSSRFLGRAPGLQLLEVVLRTKPPSKGVRRGGLPATPLRSLLLGGLVTCSATPSGRQENSRSLAFGRSGGWGGGAR